MDKKFYILKRPKTDESESIALFEIVEGNLSDPPICPICKKYLTLMKWEPPYIINIEFLGKEYGDLSIGNGDNIILSESFLNLYKKNTFGGLINIEKVKINKIKPKKMKTHLPNYYRASIIHSNTQFDIKKSKAVYKTQEICPECLMGDDLKRFERIAVKNETWPGEDIFFLKGLPGIIITSERFQNVCEQNKLKNIVFIEAGKYAKDFYPWEK